MGPILRAILRSPAGAVLIALQLALTLAIVSNSFYMIKTRIDKMERATGVQEDEVLLARIFYYGVGVDKKAQTAIDLEYFRQLPGVKSVTATNSVPLGGSNNTSTVCFEPGNPGAENCPEGVSLFRGSQEFIDALGLNLVAGRRFNPADYAESKGLAMVDSNVLIMSKVAADFFFPKGDALGKVIYLAEKPQTIIGIVEKLQRPSGSSGDEQGGFSVIVPANSTPGYLVIRAEPSRIAELKLSVEQDLIKLNDGRVILAVQTMLDLRERNYRNDQAIISMLILVVLLLVVVTALGISGLVSFTVASRRKQIGTRRALGAKKSDIIKQFMLENAMISGCGVIVGAGMSLGLGQYLMHNFSMPSLNPWYVAGTIVLLLAIAQLASFFPAFKAAQISPAIATRTV